ncbi:hypothetical protein U0070_023561 [Myodes glareolus]|uniref:IQ motif and ubiquitin-like domain-containing protein n=1 Tax=Myodes glareolus TaxID=447135 RepID=A0AAW0I1C5_MYOGA
MKYLAKMLMLQTAFAEPSLDNKREAKEHECKLTQEILELIDREVDLMMRGVKPHNLEGLRKRITTLFFHYIKTPLFNPEVARYLKQQPSRATVLTPPSQRKAMHRPPRHMGNKTTAPMGSQPIDAHSQPVQGHGTIACDANYCYSHLNPGLLCSSVCIRHPACLPRLGPVAGSHYTYKTTASTGSYNQTHLGYELSHCSYSQIPGSYPTQPVTTPSSCPSTNCSSSPLTSYDQSSYSQQKANGQLRSYGQQSSYGQQNSHGQQLLTTSTPSPIRLDPTARLQRKRGVDGGSMSKGGWAGMGWGCGMGSAGERGGFNKPGGLIDEGPDLDLCLPIDPDEDSDNSVKGTTGPEVAWEAMEETEEASPLVDPGAALEEEMPSTELETGNIPVCAVETRTSPGEDNAASVVTEVQVALVACRAEEVDLWILVVLEECSEVTEVETEVALEVALTWTQVALMEENEVPQDPLKFYDKIYFCHSCQLYLPSVEFSVSPTSHRVYRCRHCVNLENEIQKRESFLKYKCLLQRLYYSEADYGDDSQIAFLMQLQDIKYLTENIWASQSVLSAWDDLNDLVMVRWDKHVEWSPWNCILLTKDEGAAHLKLPSIEQGYGRLFIHKIKHKHILAKNYFSQIPVLASFILEDSEVEAIRNKYCTDKPPKIIEARGTVL